MDCAHPFSQFPPAGSSAVALFFALLHKTAKENAFGFSWLRTLLNSIDGSSVLLSVACALLAKNRGEYPREKSIYFESKELMKRLGKECAALCKQGS
jgi:hypothetical protein